jgi:nickel-dependent lactate racemase
MKYRVPFGRSYLEFELPPAMRASVAVPRPTEPITDIQGAIRETLARPVDSASLREMGKKGDRVCIVFTDITRASPDHLLVPALLEELEAAGVRDEDITLLCGVGLHRPSTTEEKVSKLGRGVVERFNVVDQDARNPEGLIDLGATEDGIPLSVNRIAYEADLLMATGIVEPHQFAGYSGGRKTVAVGAAGEAMIGYTHGAHMLDHPGTRLAKIDGNVFDRAVTEAARRAGLRFIINVVQDEEKRPVRILAGEPEATFAELVRAARQMYEVPIPHQYDVAVAGVGYPKDANIYQASRAASYLFFAPTCVVKEGGVLIVPAPTPEGAGNGVGEQRFLETMQGASDMATLLDQMRRKGYPPGAQRAFIMAKVLEKSHVIIVGSETPHVVGQVHMISAATMDEAFRIAAEKIGRDDLEVLVVPHALLTLPVVAHQYGAPK